jgi:hypothetical protein
LEEDGVFLSDGRQTYKKSSDIVLTLGVVSGVAFFCMWYGAPVGKPWATEEF